MKNLFKILGLLWISHPMYAETTLKTVPNKKVATAHEKQQPSPFEFTALLGGSYIPNTIKGQKLQLLPYEIGPYADTLTDQSGAGAVTWGLDAKYRFMLHERSVKNYYFDSIGAGVDIFQITSAHQTGKVLQFNMPDFENYTYDLNLMSTRLMADFDLDFHPIAQHYIPFIEAGIGAASTTVAYNSDPIYPVDGPNFKIPKKTTWNFAYQAGAGMKYIVNPHFILSLHYLYANMGKADSGTSGNTATLEKPLTVDMSSHNFLFGFTYVK